MKLQIYDPLDLDKKELIFQIEPSLCILLIKYFEILGTKLAGPPMSGGKIPTVIKMSIAKFYI